ncbi:MAG: phenylacetate-CoA oxygenase subunit PaaC [Bacteroidetes bacterium]|nr:phenylacetate-CoA oxygenase subunit PaaC [Bacteroidota bacterium]MDA0903659.1 phenylacetate-CoA oxygenase subunit PaaC [Bacteroidota bacterium]MDA1242587.1 phenylacetate-CoA oxygenase subunit PaaC [Bacteroidota bacterium]
MTAEQHFQVALRLGDDAMILGQRLAEWCGHGPVLEEDIAMSNIALDLLGQARGYYSRAGALEGLGRDEDQLAFFRTDQEYRNHLLVERPNGHFGDTMVRQFLFDAFSLERTQFLANQTVDEDMAAVAAKAVKEVRYHFSHSSQWMLRLGDGTEESHRKVQQSLDDLWPYAGEFFVADDIDEAASLAGLLPDLSHVAHAWHARVSEVLIQATLQKPTTTWSQRGGKHGIHSEHLGFLLAEMQVLPRTYPDAAW